MSLAVTASITLATGRRVLLQVRHDPRTLGLMLVVPAALVGVLAWIYADRAALFDRVGADLLGVFPLVVMFLVTSVATLRERTTGTLERLMTMPLARADFVLGYALAFGALAVVQALVVSLLALGPYGLDVAGPVWAVLLVAVLDALLGTALGLCVSAFASTEFQAVQFMPAFILPQFLLCGLLVPRDLLPTVLEWVSNVLPLSYAVDAMKEIAANADPASAVLTDLGIVAAFIAGSLALASLTLSRRSA